MSVLLMTSPMRGQIDRPTAGVRFWLASFFNTNQDPSAEVFREALGIGLTKSLPHSWSFSPSLWTVSEQTGQARTADIEAHFGVAWDHSFARFWYVHPNTTVEFASNSLPYLKPRFEIGRKLG